MKVRTGTAAISICLILISPVIAQDKAAAPPGAQTNQPLQPAAAPASPQNPAIVQLNALKQDCDNQVARFRGGALDGKIVLGGQIVSAQQMAVMKKPTPAEMKLLGDYAGVDANCQQQMASWTATYATWDQPVQLKYMSLYKLVYADLLAGAITYGEANRRIDALRTQQITETGAAQQAFLQQFREQQKEAADEKQKAADKDAQAKADQARAAQEEKDRRNARLMAIFGAMASMGGSNSAPAPAAPAPLPAIQPMRTCTTTRVGPSLQTQCF